MEKSYYYNCIACLSIIQQQILCALAYLGRSYNLQLSREKLLNWTDIDDQQYKTHINELSTKGWLVEDIPYSGAVPVPLVNPKRLPEALGFLLTNNIEWKYEIESLVPRHSQFKTFERIVLALFEADIVDGSSILTRLCDSLTEKRNIAREMLSLFRYYSHGEFSPVEGGSTAYTYILLGLRYQHLGELDKAYSMWEHALNLNGKRFFNNPLTLYFLMSMYAKTGNEGRSRLHDFLKSKHLCPLNSVPAIILSEYSASKDNHPTFWKLNEYLKSSNQPYRRLQLALGIALSRLFNFDIPLDIDADILPSHKILRHEFQCVLPLEPTEIASLNTTYGTVASFATIPVPSWQQDLEELMELSNADSHSCLRIKGCRVRLVYLINGASVSVRRQYCNSNGKWDNCRRIKPHEYMATMPEMNEMDVTIFNSCKGDLTHMGLEDTLPYLIGSDRVLTGMLPPYKSVAVRNILPALIIQKEKDSLALTSNFPTIDFMKCGKTDFIVMKDEQEYDVIHILHQQEAYFRKLLAHPHLPLEAKGKLKSLASNHNLPISIMSADLPGMNTFPLIRGCSRITIRIIPRCSNNFDISFVCYPLDGGSQSFTPGKGESLYYDRTSERHHCVQRDLNLENMSLQKVMSKVSSIFKREIHKDKDVINRQQLLVLLNLWHYEQQKPFDLEWPEGGSIKIHLPSVVSGMLYLSQASTLWFRLSGKVYFDEDFYLDICDLLKTMERRHEGLFYPVDDRTYIRLTKSLKKQLDAIGHLATKEGSTVLVPSARAAEAVSVSDSSLHIESDGKMEELQQRISESFSMSIEAPSGLKASLRSYQKAGFEWMVRLDHWGAGACLADDMGLGKTVQTIAMLLYKAKQGASMVVAPAAVLYNWSDEIGRFAPSLNPIVLRDLNDRKAVLESLKARDVIIVSYSMLVNMREQLLPVEWNMVCLDEAHVIKSARTEIARTVLQLKAKTRIALTGTPLQNKAIDIWSIFHFLNPGLLGERNTFYSRYATPPQQILLRKTLSPFILRRTKKDVLNELPKKTDIIIRTEMYPQEAAVYEAVRQQAESALRLANSRMKNIFTYITRARMAACSASLLHPAILAPASKLDRLQLLIKDLTDQGKRILVFSQFIPFLERARDTLVAKGHTCLLYIGQQDAGRRQDIIRDFKSGKAQILLVSLQAGGIGLNLTEACAVIHLDVWWNPAIEHQATDRVYRIGQKQNVTVYHLVAHNTIEENIIRLHHRKLRLAESILEDTDSCLGMTADEIMNLLKQK